MKQGLVGGKEVLFVAYQARIAKIEFIRYIGSVTMENLWVW